MSSTDAVESDVVKEQTVSVEDAAPVEQEPLVDQEAPVAQENEEEAAAAHEEEQESPPSPTAATPLPPEHLDEAAVEAPLADPTVGAAAAPETSATNANDDVDARGATPVANEEPPAEAPAEEVGVAPEDVAERLAETPAVEAEAAAAEATPPPQQQQQQSTAEHTKRVAFAQPEAAAPRTATSLRQRSAPRTAVVASPSRVDVAPTGAASDGPPHATNTDATDVYTRAETERIAGAAAALTPNTVLGLFRRGGDNSHTNRMEAGSYSRYLLSTDHMPPIVLSETFHGEQPTLGTVPRNTLKRSTVAKDEGDVPPAPPQGRVQTPLTESRRRPSSSFSSSAASYAARAAAAAQGAAAMNTTFNSTTGSGTLRREVEMLDGNTFADLDNARSHRRHDPRKGKPAQPQLDYVYYNHKSKGFYVPQDPSPTTTMLHYNHLYDFGDGTRFAPLTTSPSATNASQTHRGNPHAAPPRTFAETRGCVFTLTASQRMRTAASAPAASISGRSRVGGEDTEMARQQQQRRRQRAEIQNGTSSLRTAKSIDLARLHLTQCPRPRTIEEVLADKQQGYLSTVSMGGAPHPLVGDIQQDVRSGKLEWSEVPPGLQAALTVAGQRSTYAAAQGRPSYPRDASAGQPQRTATLAQPANGLVDVMGHLRPVPAIAAATATRRSMHSTSPTLEAAGEENGPGGSYASSGKPQSGRAAKGGAASSPLPVISRLNYER